jgi:hypothetical protein
MFYNDSIDPVLRFGDVLKGFIVVTPVIPEPFFSMPHSDYKITVQCPDFSVVMSPCCSISENTISLTPLVKVMVKFFDNPFFAQDLTRINNPMAFKDSIPPAAWDQIPEETKRLRVEKGVDYALKEFFIYEANDHFVKYNFEEQGVGTNYYMIDFGNIHKISSRNFKPLKEAALKAKCCQLSVETRDQLRKKVAHYFERIPDEDKVLLET